MSIGNVVQPTFLPTEIELICHQSTNTLLLSPPAIETLIYHLMDLFISYLMQYNQSEWNIPFRKFSVLSYVKESLVDNKHLKQQLLFVMKRSVSQ